MSTPPAPALPPIRLAESLRWTAGQVAQGAWLAIKIPRGPAPRPAHVPAELVIDFDFADVPGAETDVHAAWQALHGGPDLFWTPRKGGHWVVTRAALIDAILRDPQTFSSTEIILPLGSKPIRLLPLEVDPPRHQHYRALIMPFFTPKAIAGLRQGVRELTVELIERLKPRGECEFVADLAKQLPIAIFLRLVDLPLRDRDKLLQWTEEAVRSKNGLDILWSFIRLSHYLEGWIRRRRREPGDDMLSAIVNGRIEGRPMTHAEIQGFLQTILFGGLDTVAAMLSFMTKFLAESPAHRQQLLDDPTLIPGAIDEMMRRFGIVNLSRTVARDTVLDGIALRAGDMIHVPNGLHGVDERRHPDPLRVDFTVAQKHDRHASFGGGPHRCAGALLARMELAVFLEEWLRRIPDFSIAHGRKVLTHAGQVNGISQLPLTWPV